MQSAHPHANAAAPLCAVRYTAPLCALPATYPRSLADAHDDMASGRIEANCDGGNGLRFLSAREIARGCALQIP